MRIQDTWIVPVIATALLAGGGVRARASGADRKPVDAHSIAALEARISQASAREQCYLYAELLHQMTELSLHRYAQGNVEEASALLHRVQETANKLRQAIARRDKHLQEAEILLRHTAFRLSELLHDSSSEDRPLVEQTLVLVNQTQNATLLQVFQSY